MGALTEVGNIVLNGIMGSISNTLEQHLRYSPPEFLEDSLDNLYRTTESNAGDPILVAGAAIQVRRLRIDGEIVVVLEMGMMEELIRALQPLLV